MSNEDFWEQDLYSLSASAKADLFSAQQPHSNDRLPFSEQLEEMQRMATKIRDLSISLSNQATLGQDILGRDNVVVVSFRRKTPTK